MLIAHLNLSSEATSEAEGTKRTWNLYKEKAWELKRSCMKIKRPSLRTRIINLSQDGCAASAMLTAHLNLTSRVTFKAEGTKGTCKPKLSR
jgi:hypothetical protein